MSSFRGRQRVRVREKVGDEQDVAMLGTVDLSHRGREVSQQGYYRLFIISNNSRCGLATYSCRIHR
jgi:hypothetical protein